MTFRHAIATGIARALRENPRVLFLGEEVSGPGGILAQEGCLDPDLVGARVLNMPISEAAFSGMAGGAAIAGWRPIVELMYGSFALVAADQLFNHIGLLNKLFAGSTCAPVVVRTKVTQGAGYGPQHGLNPVALFSSFPGWRVHAPADAADYVGVLNAALRSSQPIVLVEFSALYDEQHELSPAQFEARPPNGARVLAAGSDISLISYGVGIAWARNAATALANERVQGEIVDLRGLDVPSLDYSTVEESIKKTGAALFIDPAGHAQAISPRIIAEIGSRTAALGRMGYVTCSDDQPVAPYLERKTVLDGQRVAAAALELLRGIRSNQTALPTPRA